MKVSELLVEIAVGDKVTWKSAGGTSKGTVKKKLTSSKKIKGHEAKPSKDEPQYLVVSDKTGAEASHKASALKKVS